CTEPLPGASSSSLSSWLVDRIAAGLEARGLGAIEGAHVLRLRLLVLRLLRLLLAHLIAPAHATDHRAAGRPDGRALARVAGDGATHRAHGGPPRAAADKTALRCLSGWRWRRHARIDAGLLGRPGLTFRLVLRLPLRRLALLRVHERLRQAGAAAQQEDPGHRSRPRPSDRHSHRLPPCRGCWLMVFTLSASGGGGWGSRPTL